MKLVRAAWKLLVGIKDALVLVAMLLFFALLFAALNSRPTPGAIRDGALVLDLDGPIVEQPEEVAPFAFLSGQQVGRQYRLRDLVRAIDAAKGDARVKAIVLDLDRFGGAYPALLGEVADALVRVRQSGKPVLAFATGYTDGGYRLAAAASEIWMDPMGGTLFAGPGGNQLYYKGLIDKLGVNTHVYRVGKFKSFVEPYTRADQSPEAKEASTALYGALFDQWKEAVARARPKAQIANWLTAPDRIVTAANGDIARANLASGIIDKLGDRVAFGRRVADIAGSDEDKPAGWYKRIGYDAYVDAHPLPKTGNDRGRDGGGRHRRRQGRSGHRRRRYDRQIHLRRPGRKEPQGIGGASRFARRIGDRIGADQARDHGGEAAGLAGDRLDGRACGLGRLLGLDAGRRDLRRAIDDHRIDRHLRHHPDVREYARQDRRDQRWREDHPAFRPAQTWSAGPTRRPMRCSSRRSSMAMPSSSRASRNRAACRWRA